MVSPDTNAERGPSQSKQRPNGHTMMVAVGGHCCKEPEPLIDSTLLQHQHKQTLHRTTDALLQPQESVHWHWHRLHHLTQQRSKPRISISICDPSSPSSCAAPPQNSSTTLRLHRLYRHRRHVLWRRGGQRQETIVEVQVCRARIRIRGDYQHRGTHRGTHSSASSSIRPSQTVLPIGAPASPKLPQRRLTLPLAPIGQLRAPP